MAYGEIKVDNITFTNNGADQATTVSGLYRAITSGVTVTGTLSGNIIQGSTGIFGAGSVTAPSVAIGVGTTYAPGIYSPGTDQLAATTAGAQRLYIDATGKVLIGTNSASGSSLLQVNSDALINGITVGRGTGGISTNTAVGNDALLSNTIGDGNVANGYRALRFNTQGYTNVAMGLEALYNTTTGYQNTAIGGYTLRNNTQGYNNTAIGESVLYFNTTGFNNTAIGRAALDSNTTGNYNACVGFEAGKYLTTGSNNTIIGSIGGTAGLSDTVIIGAGSTERMRIDSSGRLGIGISNPLSKLVVSDNGDVTINLNNSVSPRQAGNIGTIAFSLDGGQNVSGNIRGINTGGVSGATALTFETYDGSNSTAEHMRIDSSGRLLVGTSSSAALKFNSHYSASLNGSTAALNLFSAGGFDNLGGSSNPVLLRLNVGMGAAPYGTLFEAYAGVPSATGTRYYITAEYANGIRSDKPFISTEFGDTWTSSNAGRSLSVLNNVSAINGTLFDATNSLCAYSTTIKPTWSGSSPSNRNVTGYEAFITANNPSGISTAFYADVTGANSNWGVYVNNGKSYFKDQVLVGTSSSRAAISGNEASVQIEKVGTGATGQALSATDNRPEQYGPTISLIKSRGSALGSFTVVQNNDEIGGVSFIGTDGSKGLMGARIEAFVDGTPGTNDMPGRLVFSTTADGASTPTERMRINSSGNVAIGTTTPGTSRAYIQIDDTNTVGLTINGINSSVGVSAFSNLKLTGSTPNNVTTHIGAEFVKSQSNVETIKGYSSDITGAYQTQTNFYAKLTKDLGASTNGYCYYADLATVSSGGAAYFAYFYNSTSSAERFSITNAGTTTLTSAGSTAPFIAKIGSSEVSRIDSSGRLLVGTSTNIGSNSVLQAVGINNSQVATFHLGYNGNIGAEVVFSHSRNITASPGFYTIVNNDDPLGQLHFCGDDGTKYTTKAASIEAYVDGTPGANDMPGRLVFSTTADGASSPTERMRITNAGNILYGATSTANSLVAYRSYVSQATEANSNSDSFTSQTAGIYVWKAGDGGTAGFANNCLVLQVQGGASTNPGCYIRCYNQGTPATPVFRISYNGNVANANNSYGAISDVTLKQDVTDASSAWNDLKSVRVRNYRLISDVAEKGNSAPVLLGVVAQELEQVSPGLIDQTLDEDGNVAEGTYKFVKYSILYMKAVKALQEAMERIETLEARLTAAGIE
jgi:hypothetical protein